MTQPSEGRREAQYISLKLVWASYQEIGMLMASALEESQALK